MFMVMVLVNVLGLDCHVGLKTNNFFLIFWSNICKVYVIQNSLILGQGRNLVPRGFPCLEFLPLSHRKDSHCEEAQTQGKPFTQVSGFNTCSQNLAMNQPSFSMPVVCLSNYHHLYFFIYLFIYFIYYFFCFLNHFISQ